MESIVEFFQNLPKKLCAQCGCEMEEQHESYVREIPALAHQFPIKLSVRLKRFSAVKPEMIVQHNHFPDRQPEILYARGIFHRFR